MSYSIHANTPQDQVATDTQADGNQGGMDQGGSP